MILALGRPALEDLPNIPNAARTWLYFGPSDGSGSDADQREDIYRAAVDAHQKRDLVKAGALYSRFVKLNPGVPTAWDNLGLVLAELSNLPAAE